MGGIFCRSGDDGGGEGPEIVRAIAPQIFLLSLLRVSLLMPR